MLICTIGTIIHFILDPMLLQYVKREIPPWISIYINVTITVPIVVFFLLPLSTKLLKVVIPSTDMSIRRHYCALINLYPSIILTMVITNLPFKSVPDPSSFKYLQRECVLLEMPELSSSLRVKLFIFILMEDRRMNIISTV